MDLPWYAWLCIVVTTLTWAIAWVGYRMTESNPLQRWGGYVMYAAAIYFTATGFSGQLSDEAGLSQSLVALYLLAMATWEVVSTLREPFKQKDEPNQVDEPSAETESAVVVDAPPAAEARPSDDVADGAIDLDLDEGTRFSPENRRRTKEAVSALVSRDSSDLERLKGLGTLLTQGDEPDEPDDATVDWIAACVGAVIVVAALGPGSYFAAMGLLT